MFNAKGHHTTSVNFKFGESTSVYHSCSTLFKNELFVFGGNSSYYDGDRRQISKISGCQLRRIGTLDFDHEFGACTVVNNKKLFLCFNYLNDSDRKKCRYSTEPLGKFIEAASSLYRHGSTSIASSECKNTKTKMTFYLFFSRYYSGRW